MHGYHRIVGQYRLISVMRKEKERGGGIPKGFSGQEDKEHQCYCACVFYSSNQTEGLLLRCFSFVAHAISLWCFNQYKLCLGCFSRNSWKGMKIERNENTGILLESCEWDVDGIDHLIWKNNNEKNVLGMITASSIWVEKLLTKTNNQ